MARLADLMTGLQRRLGLAPGAAAPDGSYKVVFDDTLAVTCMERGASTAVMQARIGKLPKDNPASEEKLGHLLNHNLARLQTQQEVLAADREDGCVVLYRVLSLEDLSQREFDEAMESFVNCLAFWRSCFAMGGRPRRTEATPPVMIFP